MQTISLARRVRAVRLAYVLGATLLGFVVLAPATASATALPKEITESTTLTAAGSPYTSGGTVTVAAGATLTIKPGTKLRVFSFTVKGTLKVEGTAEEPVEFLAREGSPTWCHINFESGSGASVIDHAVLGDGGGCGGQVIKVHGSSSPTIKNSLFEDSKNNAISVTQGGSPEIVNNLIRNTEDTAIYYRAPNTNNGAVNIHGNYIEEATDGIDVQITSTGTVAGTSLGENTVIGTTGVAFVYSGADIPGNVTANVLAENYKNVLTVSGTVAHSSTWNDGNAPIVGGSTITVAAGKTLTVTQGVQFRVFSFTVKGTLKVEGTAEEPVEFLAREGSPTWCHINFESGSGASVIDHAVLSDGGGCGGQVIKVHGSSSPTIKNSLFEDSKNNAISVTQGGSPEIVNNLIRNTEDTAIYYRAPNTNNGAVNIHGNYIEEATDGIDVQITSTGTVAGTSLGENTVIGTTGVAFVYSGADIPGNVTANVLAENYKNVLTVSGTVAHSSTWNDGNAPIVGGSTITVAAGKTLTVTQGVQFRVFSFTVKGTLKVEGTAEEPVEFLNRIGYSDWCHIRFEPGSGASVVNYAVLSDGGACGGGMLRVEKSASPTIKNSQIQKSTSAGIYVLSGGSPSVEWNRFRENASGVSYSGSTKLYFPNNDWGCANGPKPAGCGDSVSANIKWEPAIQLPELGGQCRGSESQCPEGADPVSLATGAFTYAHRDLLLTNKSKTPLEFNRSYNSGSAADTGLGPGWSQTGLASATELVSGAVLILRQDGRQGTFYKVGEAYKAPSGVTSTLAKVEGKFELATLGRTVYRFDASGRIASITDDHGLKTTYGYDANGRLATITDPSSQTLTFTYDSSNHITKVKDSTGREVKFTYSAAGDLATVTDALGGVTEYTYDAAHRLKTIKDPRGNVILQNTYDGQGRVIEQLDGLENLWTLEYKEGETIVTEPEGGEIAYGFDGQNRQVSETDQLGHTTTTSYDEAGNVDEIVKPGGAKWTFGHDSAGNLTSVTDPEEGERSYEYDGLNRLESLTDERGETWDYEWDEDNDLVKVTDPAEGETTFTHDAAGLPLTVTDPNENTTTFTYDARGNRLTAEDALENTTAFAYNSRNQMTSTTAPGLEPEIYGRNALGDLLSVTTPEGHKAEYAYDANGMLTKATDPAEGVWSITRDAMERPTAYVDPLEGKSEIEYDGNLNRVAMIDRRGKETAYEYDLANQPTEISRPEGEDWQLEYDARGNVTSVVDPRENETTYEFDLLDRLTEAVEPLEAETLYGYDPAGNLTSFTDARANTTSLEYDDLGRLIEIDQPLERTTSFSYDGVGNLLSRTTAEGTVDLTYDSVNRLEEVAQGGVPLSGFGYDPAGRLVSATDAQEDEIELGYDDDRRLVSIDDGRGQTVSREYDSRGNLVQQIDGRGSVEYVYDALNRITDMTDPQSGELDFAYDPEGSLTEAELPNGVVTTNTYDDAGRLEKTSSKAGEAVLEALEYDYDPAGNRISQVDRLSQETTYSYDALNRLTGFDPPGEGATSYAYDPAGNRTEAGGITYAYNALNELTEASTGTTYAYDGAGRLEEVDTGSQFTSYDWSPLDELIGVDDESQEVLYAYDAFGRVASRDDGSAMRPTHYGDLTDTPIFDTDAEGQITMSYLSGPGGLLEQRSGEATSFPLRDARGDIATVADSEGAVASRQSYDPWGAQVSGPALEMGFLGAQQRRADPATGLTQMGVRSYDPNHGRFMSEDPVFGHVGVAASFNHFQYGWNNPVNRYDLDGRDVCAPTPFGKACAGEAVDDAWDWTAPNRTSMGLAGDGNWPWTKDRAQAFFKAAKKVLPNVDLPSWHGSCETQYTETLEPVEVCETPEGAIENKDSEMRAFVPGANPPGGVPGFTVPVPGPMRTPVPVTPFKFP